MAISVYQKAGFTIILPKFGVGTNVFTKIDDIGLARDMQRREGESITNFRARLYTLYTRPGSASKVGLTDAIAREFDLGHDSLITVTADRSMRLDVSPRNITVVGSGVDEEVNTIDIDVDGYWDYPTVSAVASGLNNITGITATANSLYPTQPAALLEEQSSYVNKYSEVVPMLGNFLLGEVEDGRPIEGTVLSGSISFTDDIVYATQVSGVPSSAGEWSVNTVSGRISSYLISDAPGRVTYAYSLLESGTSMNLLGNGARVINLGDLEIQALVVTSSGVGVTGEDYLTELYRIDGSTWGK